MSTNTMTIGNYIRSLDEAIPDLTREIAINKCDEIHKDVKSTLYCAGATIICAAQTVYHTSELTAMASKTMVKVTVKKAKEMYDKADTSIVRR